jgi:DNA-directed RNA polymerase omega subunit
LKIYNIDDLVEDMDGKFSLSIILAKRARELGFYLSAKKNMERTSIVPPLIENYGEDPLEIAMQELHEGKLKFTRIKDIIIK